MVAVTSTSQDAVQEDIQIVSWPPPEMLAAAAKRVREACIGEHCTGKMQPLVSVVNAPYRVCPLGAHLDHQGGTVSTMALDFGVSLVFCAAEGRTVRMVSQTFAGVVEFSLDSIPPRQAAEGPEEANWGNFPRGAALALRKRGFRLERGMHAELLAPRNADSSGVSSSAAVGVACLLALEAANDLEVSITDNVELDRMIENEYLGLNNGVMDQSAILASEAGKLTVIDCLMGAVHCISPPWGSNIGTSDPPFRILLAFSGIKGALASAPTFNNRVAECREAASALLSAAGRPDAVPILGNISLEEYESLAAASLSAGCAPCKRAMHFFSEYNRVLQGIELWKAGNLEAYGVLMNQSSHSSLHNYEVGSPQLVALQGFLQAANGVYGARFSGAGTRGACVALVRADAPVSIAKQVMSQYRAAYPQLAGLAHVIISTPSDGASITAL